jgi:peptidyl-prolyl cis-trans isomerase C
MAKKTAKKATKKTATKTTKKAAKKTTTKVAKPATKKAPAKTEEKKEKQGPLVVVLIAIIIIIILAIFAFTKMNPAIATANSVDLTVAVDGSGVTFTAEDNGKNVVVSQDTYDYIDLLFTLNGIQTSEELIIEEAVLREVLYANAKAAGKSSDEVISEEMFNARLFASNYTYEEFLDAFSKEIKKDYVVQEYFNEEILNNIPTQEVANARHILICYSGKVLCDKNRTRQEAQDLANNVLTQTRADNSQVAFAEFASEYSDGPSGVQGGQLLPFTRGEMVPEFDTTVFSMEVEEVAGLVETDYGFHIIRLDALNELPNPQASVQVLTDMKNAIMNTVEIQ